MLKTFSRRVFNTKNIIFLQRSVRNASNSKLDKYVFGFFSPKIVKPPYSHVCQIGDPVLRLSCEPIDVEEIKTDKFKQFVNHLISVMRKYDAFGMSAPQIGVPVQVCVIETTKKQYEDVISANNAGQQIEIVPLQIFINPKMKILDFNTTEYPESCASVHGFSAHVPRAKRIKVDALDLSGKPFTWKAENWHAKVAQHELDHLRGIVYTDKMDPKTFSCTVWEVVNRKRGRIAMDFFPITRSQLRKFFFI